MLRTLVFIEKQVTAAGKRWFKVRVMPYRTQDNVISGVVITFADITDLKLLEAELQQLKQSWATESLTDLILVLDDRNIESSSSLCLCGFFIGAVWCQLNRASFSAQ